MMIEAIKLERTQETEALKMEHLGKINVICGKNSSGKTSILRQIESKNNIFYGSKINRNDIEGFYKEWGENSISKNITLNGIPYDIRSIFSKVTDTSVVIEKLLEIDDYFYPKENSKIGEYFLDITIETPIEKIFGRGREFLSELENSEFRAQLRSSKSKRKKPILPCLIRSSRIRSRNRT